jgi:hypothetical protein
MSRACQRISFRCDEEPALSEAEAFRILFAAELVEASAFAKFSFDFDVAAVRTVDEKKTATAE